MEKRIVVQNGMFRVIHFMGRAMKKTKQKTVFGHMRVAKAQISLRIRVV